MTRIRWHHTDGCWWTGKAKEVSMDHEDPSCQSRARCQTLPRQRTRSKYTVSMRRGSQVALSNMHVSVRI